MQYQDMTKKEMQREYHRLCQRYQEYEQQGLQLDLSRGKPAPEQLALSQRMLGELNSRSVLDSEDGTDCRNYGGLDGIPEAKALLAGMIGARPEQVMVGGNSSLTMMFDILSHAMLDGLLGAEPWVQVKDRKFLCPVPGYDRHFAMTEHFGFQLIPIPMHNDGPDMDMIEDLVQRDASIKGIWCVPKYQNPTGIVFSPMVVERFAHLQPAAPDFRIFWDNAYCVHDLYPNAPAVLPDILSACANAGHPDMVYEFCSTSKVSFPGAGISGVAASSANLIDLRKVWKFATIGPDKLNQLRQARFSAMKAALKPIWHAMPACCAPSSSRSSPFPRGTGRQRHCQLDGTPRRLLPFLRYHAGLRGPHGGALPPGRCQIHPRRFHLALWPRPARQQRPYCPQLCQRRGDRTCGPAVYHLRAACHTGKAGGYPLCIRNRPWRGAHRLNLRSLAVLHKHRSFPSPSKPHKTARFV